MYICHSMKNGKYDYEEILCHLEEWGIPVSNRTECEEVHDENLYALHKRIQQEKYVVVALSEALVTDISVLADLECIRKLFEEKQIKVFTFIKGIMPTILPKRLEWIKDTVILQADTVMKMHEAVYRIVLEYTANQIGAYRNCMKQNVWKKLEEHGLLEDDYLLRMKNAYKNVVEQDYETQITLLFGVYHYLSNHLHTKDKISEKCMDNLFSYIGMCMPFCTTQVQIAQHCILMMMHNVQIT